MATLPDGAPRHPPHPSAPLRLAVVLGSVTPPGRLRRALADAAERSRARADVELLDLAVLRVGLAGAPPPHEVDDDTPAVLEALADADAVVLATPVYRGSLTGALKNVLDLTPVEVLAGKPVALVAMGATPHHYLGADRHLRDVLAFFGAHVLPVGAYLTSADFDTDRPTDAAAAELDAAFASAIELAVALRAHAVPTPAPLFARHAGRP